MNAIDAPPSSVITENQGHPQELPITQTEMSPQNTLPTRRQFDMVGMIYPDRQDVSESGFDPEMHSQCCICQEDSEIPLSASGTAPSQSHHACKLRSCNHWFGSSCLQTWLRENNTCPLYRTQLFRNPNLSEYLEIVYDAVTETLGVLGAQDERNSTPFIRTACEIAFVLLNKISLLIERRAFLRQDGFIGSDFNSARSISVWILRLRDLFEIRGTDALSIPSPSLRLWVAFDNRTIRRGTNLYMIRQLNLWLLLVTRTV